MKDYALQSEFTSDFISGILPCVCLCIHIVCVYVCMYGDSWISQRNLHHIIDYRTFRKGCPMELTVRASRDGMSLVVKKFINKHHHPLSWVS